MSEEFTKLLNKIYDDLTEATLSAKSMHTILKEPQDLYTHEWRLHTAARNALKMKYASIEKILDLWTAKWKKEGRLSANGYWIRIGQEEAELLGLRAESEVDVYQLANHMTRLFKTAHGSKS